VLFPAYFIPPWTWPLTFWPQTVKHSSLSIMHRWCKFGENVTNTLQDIVLTMFQTRTNGHGRTEQKQYTSGNTTLGGGINTCYNIQHPIWPNLVNNKEMTYSIMYLRQSSLRHSWCRLTQYVVGCGPALWSVILATKHPSTNISSASLSACVCAITKNLGSMPTGLRYSNWFCLL